MRLFSSLCAAMAIANGVPALEQADPAVFDIATAPDTRGTGPYPAMKEEIASFPNYVVYRPADLAALGDRKLGVYLFGNGGCDSDGAIARMHLLEIASHGYLAIAPGRIHSGPGASPKPPRGEVDMTMSRLTTPIDALDTALDWAAAENAREGSPFYQRVDLSQVAASGHSCGGLQALHTARDDRVQTVVMMNSGMFADDRTYDGVLINKSHVEAVNRPMLYVLGGPGDAAYANAKDDFRRIETFPVAFVDLPVGHGGTFAQPEGGRAAAITVDWLDWQLRGDEEAAAQFRGEDCGLCDDAGVTIERKGID